MGNGMKIFQVTGRLALVWMAVALIGCGGGDGPKLVPVKGTVTVGGSNPFANGLVRFAPKSGSKVLGGSAITDDDGNFVLLHTSRRSGVEPGEYTVFFSLMQMPDGSPLEDQIGVPDPKTPQELGGVEFVPPEYSTVTSNKYPVTVEATGGTFEFNIPNLKPQPSSNAKPSARSGRSNSPREN